MHKKRLKSFKLPLRNHLLGLWHKAIDAPVSAAIFVAKGNREAAKVCSGNLETNNIIHYMKS
jgi:hypothetical protein